jgi:dinuclear metal center YbgI/SA1388 family protein
MKANEICNYLETYFPLTLQEDWDTCGLQVGSLKQEVTKIMIALNADEETLEKAISFQCDMLITHHPLLLEKIKNYDIDTMFGRFLKKALQNTIVVYSLHTCLDKGQQGISMNDWLINTLNVVDVNNYDDVGIGKKAILKDAMSVNDFLLVIKEAFSIPILRYNRGVDKVIRKIAICGGSGADDIEKLYGQVDCFITGDTKYRHMKSATDNQLLLIDIGHHAEVIMEEKVKQLLVSLPIEIVVAENMDYYIYQ